VGLPGVPRALHPQPVHGRDQVNEMSTGQVRRALYQMGARGNRRILARQGQPHCDLTRHPVRVGWGFLGHLPGDPGLVERGQYRMAGGSQDGGRGAERLPGRPAEQAGCHPRAGREDDQQAGAVATGEAAFTGPWVRVTGEGAVTTWYPL